MSFEKDIQKLEAEKRILEKEKEKKEKELTECQTEKKSAEDARMILQLAARKTQEKIEIHFSDLVTKALKAVFDDPYTFIVKFEERRNKTECDFWLQKNGTKYHPRFSAGGGVLDVVSFALRLAYNRLERGAPILVLDEPFKYLDKDTLPKAIELLHLLSNEFNMQFLINTHIPQIAEQANKVFEIENGKSREN